MDLLEVVFGFEEDDDDSLAEANHQRNKTLLLLHLIRKKKSSRQLDSFRNDLVLEGRQRCDRNLIRISLTEPKLSAWRRCFSCGDDGALITVTGFDHKCFDFMLSAFQPLYNAYTPWCSKYGGTDGLNYRRLKGSEKRGRNRMVTAEDCLGLVLAWYRFRGAGFVLQGWFGFTGTQCNVWLRFGRRMLLKALLSCPDAIVKFPTAAEIETLKDAVKRRHNALENVYCFADGLKLHFEACSGLLTQGMYYNGWQHGHYITNLFVFSADGKVIEAVLNVPGSVHDSQVANWGRTYKKLKEVYESTGGVCVVDSAFAAATFHT